MTQPEQFRDPSEIRHPIGAAGSFSVSNISGDIRIRGTDGEEALVIARGTSGEGEFLPMVVRRGEGSLHIEVDQKPFTGFMSWFRERSDVEFDISLPRGARVEVNSISADIQIRDMLGEQSYRTVSGDLSLFDAGGRVSLTTVSGDVRLDAEQPVEPRLSTTSGDFQIAARTVRALSLRTVSGDADIRAGFETGVDHSVETVSGDVTIEARSGLTIDVKKGLDLSGHGARQRVIGDGAARLRFRSLSGDVHLSGPQGEKARSMPEGSRSGLPFSMPSAPPAPPKPPAPPAPPAPTSASKPDSLEILRALERGEIDVEEASRRLEGAKSNA